MNEQHRARECTVLVQHILEIEIIVVFESHSAEDDHIDFRLHRDPREELIIRLAGDRENRKFLGFDQRVEQVDHRDTGPDHLPGNDTLCRIHGRSADVNLIGRDRRTGVTRISGSVEDASEQILGGGNLHRMPEKTDLVSRADSAGTCEHLQKHFVVLKTNHLRQRNAAGARYFGKIVVSNVIRFDGNHVTGDLNDFVVNLTH